MDVLFIVQKHGGDDMVFDREEVGVAKNKVAAHRSFKPPKHDLGRVQSIQKYRESIDELDNDYMIN